MWRIYAIIALVVLTLGAVGFGYFQWSQEKMAKLNQDIAERELAIAEQNDTINTLNGRIDSVQDAYANYNVNVNRHRESSNRLAQEITSPALNENASTQPRETEALINQFTENLFNQFELISRGHTAPVENSNAPQ